MYHRYLVPLPYMMKLSVDIKHHVAVHSKYTFIYCILIDFFDITLDIIDHMSYDPSEQQASNSTDV